GVEGGVGQTANKRQGASTKHISPSTDKKRPPGEPAEEPSKRDPGDVEEPEPLVLGCPPEGALRAIVECQVDPIVTHGVPDGMGYRLFLMNTVEARSNPVVKGEGIPGESPGRPERGRDPLEGSAAVSPGR